MWQGMCLPSCVGEHVGLLFFGPVHGEQIKPGNQRGWRWSLALNLGHRSNLFLFLAHSHQKDSLLLSLFNLNTFTVEYQSHCKIFFPLGLSCTKNNWPLCCHTPAVSFIPANIKLFLWVSGLWLVLGIHQCTYERISVSL